MNERYPRRIALLALVFPVGVVGQSLHKCQDETGRSEYRQSACETNAISKSTINTSNARVLPQDEARAIERARRETAAVNAREQNERVTLEASQRDQALKLQRAAAAGGGKVIIGQTADQVRLAWGEPRSVNRTIAAGQISEQWVYPSTKIKSSYVYLTNGVVTAMQD